VEKVNERERGSSYWYLSEKIREVNVENVEIRGDGEVVMWG
jgi:hypothetical protein